MTLVFLNNPNEDRLYLHDIDGAASSGFAIAHTAGTAPYVMAATERPAGESIPSACDRAHSGRPGALPSAAEKHHDLPWQLLLQLQPCVAVQPPSERSASCLQPVTSWPWFTPVHEVKQVLLWKGQQNGLHVYKPATLLVDSAREIELRLYHHDCCADFRVTYRSSAGRVGRP